MTETSAMWDGTTLGDAATYAAAYCADEVARYQRSLTCLADRTSEGPVYSLEAAYNGQLECTNPAGVQIQVDTGRALVNGWVYENDAAVTLNPASGNGFYRVVLQLDTTTQTIRAALIYNAVATPTLTQNEPGVWEIALANFEIAAGAITAAGVVDERDFVNAKTDYFWVQPQAAYNFTALSAIGITAAFGSYQGPSFFLPTAAQSAGLGYTTIPSNFITGLTITGVCGASSALAGNVYVEEYYQYAQCTGAAATVTSGLAAEAIRVSLLNFSCHAVYTVPDINVTPGDIVRLGFSRDATNILDTLADTLKFIGWNCEYFGYRR